MIVNNTPHAVEEAIVTDADGRELLVAAIKASFRWRPDAALEPLAAPAPIATMDVYGGKPAASGLLIANELTLPKPRVDVLLAGEIVLGAPREQVDCALEVGAELRKAVRVFGDRHWRPSAVRSVLPSRPRPFARMPIAWERSFGGTDAEDPGCVDRRNPVGRGVSRRPGALEGRPAPSFEHPDVPISDPNERPAPIGFGPLAPHWLPRAAFAGTYDAAWERDRYPLLPVDFDPRFLNAAPADQQLARYLAGAEVRLTDFTPARRDRFRLPAHAPALTVVEAHRMFEVASVVDTIVIEPALARVSIVARAVYAPKDVTALATAFVGPLTRGQRRALETGKLYLRRAP